MSAVEHNGIESQPKQLLVNITQAAQILSVSRTTIYQLIWNDELAPIRIGRSVRFTPEQLETFVHRRLTQIR